METHAHHLHKAPGKNFWHYFFEFFMLFLAVFCGFLVENYREHIVEHEREKQYMQTFIYDLQNDTTNLNAGFPLKDQRIAAIDSVFLFYETNANAASIPGNLLRQIRRTVWDRHYRRNSTTIDQLKNAGGLRLISSRIIRDSIAAYDLKWQRAEFSREYYITLQQKEKNLIERMIKAEDMLFTYRTKTDVFGSKAPTESVGINNEFLNEYLNTIGDQKISTLQDKRTYLEIEQSAERLITLIQKEYQFE